MSAKEQLAQATKRILFTVIKVREEVVHVAIGNLTQEQMNDKLAEAQDAMKRGHAIRWPDGSVQWREKIERHPAVWHDDGNRILGDEVRVIKDPDGSVMRHPIRKVWMSP